MSKERLSLALLAGSAGDLIGYALFYSFVAFLLLSDAAVLDTLSMEDSIIKIGSVSSSFYKKLQFELVWLVVLSP